MNNQTEFVCGLLYIVVFALLMRAGLALWVDCGKPCGYQAAKASKARGVR